LNRDLTSARLKQVTTEVISYENNPAAAAFLEVIVSANFQTYQNLMETQDMKTLKQHLKEMGIFDQLIAEERNEIRDEIEAKQQADKIEVARKL
jgi:hypothetical protein